ncbi:MAG: hypothetical protein KJ066_13925 [Acidobacteria bacterium]|nr:hypothetical protein [Acidobacteriota bacterium]
MRTSLVILACAAPLLWLVATATLGSASSPAQRAPTADRRAARVASGTLAEELRGQADRLRERLANAPAPRTPSRDPFRYRVSDAPSGSPSPFSIAAPSLRPGEAVPVRPAAAPLRLVGIAEDTVDGALVRRAILSGLGDLFIVGAGESIADRYTVGAVGVDAVELDDRETGERIRLGLR